VQEIDLPPFKRRLGPVGCVWRAGLHALDVTNMLDLVHGSVAIVLAAGNCAREEGSKAGYESEGAQQHHGSWLSRLERRENPRRPHLRFSQVKPDPTYIWRCIVL
jgi:hypothetical protein